MRRFLLLISFTLTLCAAALAQAPQKKTLPNGLTILVQENHAAPVVAVRFYVKTGSIYEGEYLGTGISHLFEHVLQEGSKTRTKEQINQEAQAIGGQTNAYTTDDVTAYHITTASRYFERALNNLADSLMNAVLPEAEVKTQQGIIHHEMTMNEDDPNRVLYNTWQQTAYLVHPTRFPVIGYRESFDALTREDIVNYYKTHYTPENTILAVAGDVKAEDVFAATEKAMGSWTRRTAATPAIPDEPMQTTPRRAVVEKQVQNASIMMGWHTIPLQHPDLYALDALAGVLGGGESSRLVRELRDKRQLAYAVTAWSHTPNYNGGTFVVRASLPAPKIKAFEDAVWQEINKIKSSGVAADELKRAQRQIETSYVFNNDVANQAERMAYDYLGTGDPAYSSRYVARINAVTPAQVQAAAKKYLLPNGTTTAIVQPITKAAAAAPSTPANAVSVKPAQMFTLKNGLRVIVRENRTTPTVAISVMGMGGARYETAEKAGLASITAELLGRGTTKRSADAFNEIVEEMGGSLSTSSGYNTWILNSNWLARDWRRGLSLAHEALTMPAFPANELARAKTLTLAGIREQEDDPDTVASLLTRKTFYGDHPYGRSLLGTESTVAGITRADVVQFWNEVRDPKQTVLAIYGDVSASEARRVAEYLFGGWRAHQDVLPNAYAPHQGKVKPLPKRTEVIETKAGIEQTVLNFAFPGIEVQSPDRYALTVLDGALSGIYYPGGRLHARLRDNQLVYGVHAYSMAGLENGSFMIVAATQKEKRDEVKSIIEEEVGRIRSADISAEELERAKGMAITAHAVDLQTNQGQASDAILDELYGLGYNDSESYEQKINAVTLADVRRVAQKYLRDENSAYVVVMPE